MTGRQLRTDRVGTRTDVVARRPDGRLLAYRPLFDRAARGLGTPGVAPGDRLGAFARRTGRPDGRLLAYGPLFDRAARGFGTPRVAPGDRPAAFARTGLSALPHDRVVELHEGTAADGTVLRAPDLDGPAGLHRAHRHRHLRPARRPVPRSTGVGAATVRTSSPATYSSSKPRAPKAAARRRPTPSSRRRDR
ncbi:hypothetical protein ABTX62_28770 [Streptomyces sp. NPDC096046]|uniref:hypothetical protein n=1 Tax=Streptomyces sp. NPDC096046 TaxID=3155542 RepID=UPI0033205BD6